MGGHERIGSREVIFLIDIAGCATPASARGAKETAFRRQVAREHAVMVASTIERLLCHADELTNSGVHWTYRIFDSRDASFTAGSAASLCLLSAKTVDDCRKAVQSSFDAGCKRTDASESCLSLVGAALADGVSIISTTDPTKPGCRKKNYDEPLVVLLASASYGQKELDSFSEEENISSEANSEFDDKKRTHFFGRMNDNLAFNSTMDKLVEAKTQLLWVHSYNRRVENTSKFNPELQALFKNWLLQKRFVSTIVDMHSLLLDRSVVPFSCVARRILCPASCIQKTVVQRDVANSSTTWMPLEFVLPPLHGVSDVPRASERLLKVELSDIRLNNPHTNRVWAVCEALVKYSSSDSELAAVGAFNAAPGLIRPTYYETRPAEYDSSTTVPQDTRHIWIGAFSGLMMALAHTGHYLLASIYCHSSISNTVEHDSAILVQPLTPLCGIVRRVSASSLNKSEIEPLLSSNCKAMGDQNPLRKRVFGGPSELNRDLIDSIGDASNTSQSARFFEAHLSSSDTLHENITSNASRCASILKNLTRSSSPRLISELLEGHIENITTNRLDELGTAITEHHAKGVIDDCRSSVVEQDIGEVLMADLVSRLKTCTTSPPPSNHAVTRNPEEAVESSECYNKSTAVLEVPHASDNTESVPLLSENPDTDLISDSAKKDEGMDASNCDKVDNTRLTTLLGQIENDIARIATIDSDDLILQGTIVLRSLARLVDLGSNCQFSFTDDTAFTSRILKLKQIQKKMGKLENDQETSNDSVMKLDRSQFAQCLLFYEQAVLHVSKEIVKFEGGVFGKDCTSAKQKRAIEKRLKRVSKILNIVLAVAVSRDRYITDGNPYHELFDEFFKTVVSRLVSCGVGTAAGVLGKAIADEFERVYDLEPSSAVVAACQVLADECTPSSATHDVLPPLHKRRRPRDASRRDSRDRKRPRTKELKRVLAEATASRLHTVPARRDSSQGLRNLEHEKGIQRPLQTKSKTSPSGRRISPQSSDPLLMQFNLGRRRKHMRATGDGASKNMDTAPKALNRLSFYSESNTAVADQMKAKRSNPVLVPGTPSDND